LAPPHGGGGGRSPSLQDASLEELAAELESRLGFCPSLYRVAEAYPAASWGLYEFAKATYVANPLPPLLKEQLFTYLSRFCRIPYCLARHATFLAGLRPVADTGSQTLTDEAIEQLLSEPLPTFEQLAAALEVLQGMTRPLNDWPNWSSTQGELLKQACVQLFTRPVPARAWLAPLRRWLGEERYEQLAALLAFIRTAHYWTKLHPEIGWEADVTEFVERHPQLGRFFQSPGVDWEYPAGPGEWERQQADAATWKANHEFAHRVIENLYTFVGVLDLDGRLLLANRAPLQAAALEPLQVIGQLFWDCSWWNYDRNVRERLREAYARARAGELVRYDVPVRMAGDRRMWIDFQLSPLCDDAGEVTHIIASAMDISRRQAMEAQLVSSEERLRLAAEAAGFGMYSFDAANDELVWNERMREIFLLPDDAPPSMEFLAQSFHADDREICLQKIAAGIDPQGDGVLDHEHRIVRPDGSLRWVAVRGRTEFVDGQIARSFGAVIDVTARKAIEQALRDSETRFRQLFESAPTGILLAKPTGHVVAANAALGKLLGYSPADLTGRDFRTFQHPEDIARNLTEIGRVLSGEVLFAEFESRCLRSNGEYVWARKVVSVLRDETDAPSHFMVLVTDITERREADHRIRERRRVADLDRSVHAVRHRYAGAHRSAAEALYRLRRR
jgi:PAS domain S-box-containing protein